MSLLAKAIRIADAVAKPVLGVILGLVLGLAAGGCQDARPILVGFTGQLTGHHADLGVQGRDGAQLAMEEINLAGGVNGRPIEMIYRDDKGSPQGAVEADQDLIKHKVVAIIGHITSSQSMAGLPVAQKAGTLMLSPTTSTTKLSGRDDLFFRVQPGIDAAARALARHVRQGRGISSVCVVYDTDNQAYSKAFLNAFWDAFVMAGGNIQGQVPFSSASNVDLAVVLARSLTAKPQGLLVIASAVDTALIAQRVRLWGWSCPIFSSGWAQTQALIHNGGRAAEGIEIVADFDGNSPEPAYLAFKKRFLARFQRQPIFAAAQSYEAVMVLAQALIQTGGQSQGLPQALLRIKNYQGLLGPLSFDRYGDVKRLKFLVTIKGGQFQTLKAVD